MNKFKLSVLLLFLLVVLFQPNYARRGGGFGGFGRGSSGSRTGGSSGGFNSGRSPSGGFANKGPGAGGISSGSSGTWRGGRPGFSSGTGLGSASRGSAFKSALAGAAIGGLAGVAIGGLISSATSPFHWNNRPYYWGSEYYRANGDQFMCTMPLDQLISNTNTNAATTAAPVANGTTVTNPDQTIQNLHFPNGTRPKTIVWGCKRDKEICCGTECCPNPQASSSSALEKIGYIIIGIILLILLCACCFCFLAYKLCREAFDRFMPTQRANRYEDKYYDDTAQGYAPPPAYRDQQQSYPMQPYPSQSSYPPASGFQPNSGSAYPPYPHEPQKY